MRYAIPSTILIACATLADAGTLMAQTLRDQCADVATGTVAFCESLADAAVSLPPRLVVAAAGGNPVPGTGSTLGMRLPGSPRWSIGLRGTLARAELPALEGGQTITPTLWSINADASVGLFNGFNLLPTVGGVGSIDVLGSFGLVSEHGDDGFGRSSPVTWALGTRVGVLRESFTAPGVSVSAMYRSLPGIEFGDTVRGPYFENAEQSVLSIRGTVGKRIFGLGLTAGIGYDRGSSDVTVLYDEGPIFPSVVTVTEEDVEFDRTSFFGNVSYTLLILNLSAELGWQESGDRPTGAHDNTGKGGLFGGIAVRLAI